MDCVLMETSAYKELQAHLQRLLERVAALHSLSAKPISIRWLIAEEVCKALSITKRALQHYRYTGIILYTALGNNVLFRDNDIRQLLEVAWMARSTFYYHLKRLKLPDKYAREKEQIAAIYHEHKGSCWLTLSCADLHRSDLVN